jgi:hypothetical protein
MKKEAIGLVFLLAVMIVAGAIVVPVFWEAVTAPTPDYTVCVTKEGRWNSDRCEGSIFFPIIKK